MTHLICFLINGIKQKVHVGKVDLTQIRRDVDFEFKCAQNSLHHEENNLIPRMGFNTQKCIEISIEIDCSVYNNELKDDSLNIFMDKIDASDIF